MFWYLPFFTFGGAILYLFPEVGLWAASIYLTILLLPRIRNTR